MVVPLRSGGRAGAEDNVSVPSGRYDAVAIGSGHNGLISAAYLVRAGRRVCGAPGRNCAREVIADLEARKAPATRQTL